MTEREQRGGEDEVTRRAALRALEAATAAEGPPPKRPRPWLRRLRGLLDLLAVFAAGYTLVAATPMGGLLQRGANYALGRGVQTRPLVTYFRIGPGGAGVEAKAVEELARSSAEDAPSTPAARASGVDPEVARALGLILSGGKQQDGHYLVKLPAAAAASFAAVGAAPVPIEGGAEARQTAMLTGVGKLAAALHSEEAAVAALAVELSRVQFAVRRATAADAAEPSAYGSFRDYLTPDDRAEADAVVHGTFALVTAFGMQWPVAEDARVSSPFGWRTHPVLGRRKKHSGIDLAVPTGTSIKAIAAGRVVYTAQDGVNGRFLKLDHGHGLTSIYCHNSKVLVRRGQRLERGVEIAKSGATGRVSGPHLHFQMEIDDVPVDPAVFYVPEEEKRKEAEEGSVRTTTATVTRAGTGPR